MALTSLSGPLVVSGQTPSVISGQPPAVYNADVGPSAFAVGTMLLDPRSSPQGAAYGFYSGQQIVGIDYVPSAISSSNLASLANVVIATPMTLRAASGAGITVTTAAQTIAQTGNIVPTGQRVIDGVSAAITFGTSGKVGVFDPRTAVARAVSITGVVNGAGGAFVVRGYDIYGVALSETTRTTTRSACRTCSSSRLPCTTSVRSPSPGTARRSLLRPAG